MTAGIAPQLFVQLATSFQISNSEDGSPGCKKSCNRLFLAGVLRVLLVSRP
jgi:hypothetical protein